jgi:hypothetical protein
MQDAAYFRNLNNPQLDFAIKDIREALAIAEADRNPLTAGKYSDQLFAALGERRRREGKDCCPTCQRPL